LAHSNGRDALEGLRWYFFIPIAGYFLYLPIASREFPDVRGWRRVGMVLENTALYIALGALTVFVGMTIAMWLATVTGIVLGVTAIEFLVMRKWGDRFRRLGWHHIRTFTRRRLVLSVIYVAVQTWSFLNLGYAVAHYLMWPA
jgi:hypothetical protein